MNRFNKTPVELRSMFGANLRLLASDYPSISELSRQLGINRTQFNRYLAGESFPRPDVLARICDFFDVDARVLLEPVENLGKAQGLLRGGELRSFLGAGVDVPESAMPSGFYRFSSHSSSDPARYILGVVRVWRGSQGGCFVRGFDARSLASRASAAPADTAREFRGIVLCLGTGLGLLGSRRHAAEGRFSYLRPVSTAASTVWIGHKVRARPEGSDKPYLTRLVYEHLGTELGPALQAARLAGLTPESQMPDLHLRMLREPSQVH